MVGRHCWRYILARAGANHQERGGRAVATGESLLSRSQLCHFEGAMGDSHHSRPPLVRTERSRVSVSAVLW